jgi:hypothetical protein
LRRATATPSTEYTTNSSMGDRPRKLWLLKPVPFLVWQICE